MTADLFEPFQFGGVTLDNRMVMAPMTRNRADRNGAASEIMAMYYAQRASAGLIIAESTRVSAGGTGYPFTPGIFTAEHSTSWRKVTDGVHAADGRIVLQLQHCGRISHPSLLPGGEAPVAPSAIKPNGQAVTYDGTQDYVVPRALETAEVQALVSEFGQAARLAKAAGFDGVEIHGANGYIIDQFLRDGTNQRTDVYGGSVKKRMRLLNEVIDAVCEVWPTNQIGLRLTPENSFNSMSDSAPAQHFGYFVEQLGQRGLGYLHVLEGDMHDPERRAVDYRALKSKFGGTYIANHGYDLERAQVALRGGSTDLVAFGVPFLANPDLVRRYRERLPLNRADHSTFYGGTAAGYTDYPAYGEAGSASSISNERKVNA
jgi:N-ethylmaleimide reductase